MSERFEPPESPAAAPFWQGTREQKLLLQWCRPCAAPIFFPREACPACLGVDLDWRESTGEGEVYACSVMHRAGNRQMQDRVPYVVALVDLDEGVRMMSNVVGCAPGAVRVGMRVRVTWEALSDGRALPLFEPAN